jgi:hypothetical protein
VHLGAAWGAPWLPTEFTITVRWPAGRVGDWAGASRYGAAVAARILRRSRDITLRKR